MSLVRLLDVCSRLEQPLEDEVLDQVGRGELRAASVERLEDLLGVLVGCEVDDDHLEKLTDDGLDCRRARCDIFDAVQQEPLASLLAEEPMGLDHSLAGEPDDAVVERRLGAHHGVERWAVAVRRPDLELILGPGPERLRVRHERLDPHCRRRSAHREQLDVQGVQQQLQRRQPLLAVDDRSLLHQPGRVLDLLQDDGAEKVRMVLPSGLRQEPIGHPNDVVPQRLPLVLLVPDVRSLEQRHDKPLRLHEHHLRCPDLRLHTRGLYLSGCLGEESDELDGACVEVEALRLIAGVQP